MKERSILFSGPMVRALLDGRKSQTRRTVKPQPQPNGGAGLSPIEPYQNPAGDWGWVLAATGHGSGGGMFPCPYGVPGDRLWVRETWVELRAEGEMELSAGEQLIEGRRIVYRANCGDIQFCDGDGFTGEIANREEVPRWRPSIFMPRWASRILLEVVSIRVERLQEISEEDAIAEGVTRRPYLDGGQQTARRAYEELWESINGPGSWDANPWVWVVEFKRIGGGP